MLPILTILNQVKIYTLLILLTLLENIQKYCMQDLAQRTIHKKKKNCKFHAFYPLFQLEYI